MRNVRVGRRQLLKALGAGALGAGAVTALSTTTALAKESDRSADGDLVGTWEVTFEGVPPVPHREAVVVFTPGGGLFNVQADFPTAGLGAWAHETGSNSTFTIIQWDYRDGTPPAKVVVRGQVHESSHSAIAGTYASEVSRGGVVIASGSFAFTGTRLEP